MKQNDISQQIDGLEADNVTVLAMCKCGRAPHRKGQRNCHFCNVEANKKYRQSLKRQREVLGRILKTIEQC